VGGSLSHSTQEDSLDLSTRGNFGSIGADAAKEALNESTPRIDDDEGGAILAEFLAHLPSLDLARHRKIRT